MVNVLLKRFSLTKGDCDDIKDLTTEEAQFIQFKIEETYYAAGEITTQKYLRDTQYKDEELADHVNLVGITTAIYHNPYRVIIHIPDYPPRLREYSKTKFSRDLSYYTLKKWHFYMGIAIRELYEKGITIFTEKAVLIIKYHYPQERSDVDNYAIKYINDALKYSNIIKDDSHDNLSIYNHGITDKVYKGIEITLLSHKDFMKYIDELI